MGREKISGIDQLYKLYKKEEEERHRRVHGAAQGLEVFYYILFGIGIFAFIFIEEVYVVPLFWSCFMLYLLPISVLYYTPLLYEKEGVRMEWLLKKYRYTPVNLKELCLAKTALFCYKMGKLYVAHILAAVLSGLAFFSYSVVFTKIMAAGLGVLGMSLFFALTLVWQYCHVEGSFAGLSYRVKRIILGE